MVFGPRLARLLGEPDDPPPESRARRSERPVRRPFQTGWISGLHLVVGTVLWFGGAVGLAAIATEVGVVWMVAGFPLLVAGFVARLSTHPWDFGLQIYDDTSRLHIGALPRGVRSSQLFVPYGLALGWFVRRGLVSEWFRRESGGQIDDLLAGRLSGPHLYAWWGGIFASDMLNDEGKAFARRYMISMDEPWGRRIDLRSGGALELHTNTGGSRLTFVFCVRKAKTVRTPSPIHPSRWRHSTVWPTGGWPAGAAGACCMRSTRPTSEAGAGGSTRTTCDRRSRRAGWHEVLCCAECAVW